MRDYDLLDERWLTCAMLDGRCEKMGILDLLRRASDIREIAEPSPLVTFGAYRFLLAVTHWLGPVTSPDDWSRRWKVGRFPETMLDDLRRRGDGCFDLFHQRVEWRFYQTPPRGKKREKKPVSYLALHLPVDTNINHFHHLFDKDHAFCPACCAKGLLTLPPFAQQLTWCYPASVNGTPPLYVFPCGHSLFQTLLLNLPIATYEGNGEASRQPDGPVWERHGTEVSPSDVNVGFLRGLTWQPRQVLLATPADRQTRCTWCGETGPVVDGIALTPSGVSAEKRWSDPHVALSETSRPLLLTASPGNQGLLSTPGFWCRQFTAILAGDETTEARRPPALRQIRRLAELGVLPPSMTLTVLQMAFQVDPRQQGKTIRTFSDRFRLPLCLVTDTSIGRKLRTGIRDVEDAASCVADFVAEVYQRKRDRWEARKRTERVMFGFHTYVREKFLQVAEGLVRDQKAQNGTLVGLRQSIRDLALAALESAWLCRPNRSRWHRHAERGEFEKRLDTILRKGDEQ